MGTGLAGLREVGISEQGKCLLLFVSTVFRETGLRVHSSVNKQQEDTWLVSHSLILTGTALQDSEFIGQPFGPKGTGHY